MACAGGGGAFETAYFARSARVRTYKIEGTTLTLSGEGSAALTHIWQRRRRPQSKGHGT